MGHKPHIFFAMKSPAERALLCAHLSTSIVPNVVEESSSALAEGAIESPQIIICEPEPGEAERDTATRLRERFPHALLVLIVDAAGPSRALPAETLPAPDAVLVRPLTAERLDAVLTPILRRAARPAKPRVLVVDDDPEVLHFVEQVLGKAGCEVTAVSDPRRYLARPTAPEFDLALLDVVMPEVDGLQLCLRLRATGRDDLRICMMSAADDPESERKADLYGADEFLPKPLLVRELHALVGRASQLGRKPGAKLRAAPSPLAPRGVAQAQDDLSDS